MARVACLFSVEYYRSLERPLPGWDKVPFGLGLVAACLERAGHEVQCWVICPDTPLEEAAGEMVDEFRCDAVAASAVTTQFELIHRMLRKIRQRRPGIPTLLGGVHASLRPEECIAPAEIDAICIGEGEDVAVAWANAIARGEQPSGIPGAWIKIPGSTEIERTPAAPFRTDLDELPLLNLRHWERWIEPDDRALRVVVGRGCPYSCTYCSNHALRRLHEGQYLRFRSPDKIVKEIEGIVERFPDLRSLYLEVETIGSSHEWALRLCDRLAAFNATLAQPLAFHANLAVTTSLVRNPDRLQALLAAFRRANLVTLNVGLESGSPQVRKAILNRPPYTNEDLIQFCTAARDYGIGVILYLLLGLPTETPADTRQTSAVARACRPIEISESIFYPYPGTRLRAMAEDLALIDPSHLALRAERSRVYLKLPEFPRWRVFFEYVTMSWRVFHGRWPVPRIARRMLSRSIRIAPGIFVAAFQIKGALRHGDSAPASLPRSV